jgi:predicted DsbA family dithiol-disulfide isomerase
VLGEDLEDAAVIDRHASKLGIDLMALHAALADDSAAAAVKEAEIMGRKFGVRTPAWLLAQRLITGLCPAAELNAFRSTPCSCRDDEPTEDSLCK